MAAEEVLSEWNLKLDVTPIQPSVWSVGDAYVLKAYDDRRTIQRNAAVSEELLRAGLPVAEICPLPDGRRYAEWEGRFWLLSARLKGSRIRSDACDAAWFETFGTVIARLHLAFLACGDALELHDADLMDELNGWIGESLRRNKPAWLPEDVLESEIRELAGFVPMLPRQPIHRDVHPGNFLFEGCVFSGYVDFDLSQRNIRIFDLCYFLLGILSEGVLAWSEPERWLLAVRCTMSGYGRMIRLEDAERRAMPCVMKCIELLFVAYGLNTGNDKAARTAAELHAWVDAIQPEILAACGAC